MERCAGLVGKVKESYFSQTLSSIQTFIREGGGGEDIRVDARRCYVRLIYKCPVSICKIYRMKINPTLSRVSWIVEYPPF